MPRAPAAYDPTPNVARQDSATPGISVNTPEAAFGGATAQAQQGLGRAISQVGDEMFQRAMAMQAEANETEAKNADADYMMEAGRLHAAYNTLEGDAAVKAYPKYQKDLNDARLRIRDRLTNHAAQKMYDSSALSVMSRTLFNGAGYAAGQNKKASLDASNTRIRAIEDSIYDQPDSPEALREGMAKVENEVRSQNRFSDASEEVLQQKVKDAQGRLAANYVLGVAKTQPLEAQRRLDEAKKNGLISGALLEKVEQQVTTQGRASAAANITQEVYGGARNNAGGLDKTLDELVKDGVAKARAVRPNDDVLEQQVKTTIQGEWQRHKTVQRVEEGEARDTLNLALRDKDIRTVQQLLADENLKAAYNRLPAKEQAGMQNYLNRLHEAKVKLTNEATKIRLNGMATSDDQDARADFMSMDLTKEQLNTNDIIRFQNMQAKMRKDIQADPRVAQAMAGLRASNGAELEALGVFRRTDTNKDEYDRFVGALQSGIEAFTEDHKRRPTAQEIRKEIYPNIIRTHAEPGRFWGTNQTPFFQSRLTDDQMATIRTNLKAANPGVNFSDEEIYREYTRQRYRNLYSAKPKAPNGPSVPQSQ